MKILAEFLLSPVAYSFCGIGGAIIGFKMAGSDDFSYSIGVILIIIGTIIGVISEFIKKT